MDGLCQKHGVCFQVVNLETKAFDFLMKNMSPDNCYGIYKLAKDKRRNDFAETAKAFILR